MKKILMALLAAVISLTPLFAAPAKGDRFPAELTNSSKKKVDGKQALKGKTVLVYFSAHWCPPCRRFTPILVKFYKKMAKKKNLEVVFVSCDRSEDKMFEYMKKTRMPWLAVPYSSPARQQLMKEMGIRGIPSLVVIGADGKVITKNGVRDVDSKGNKAADLWEEGKESKEKSKESKSSSRKKRSRRSRD